MEMGKCDVCGGKLYSLTTNRVVIDGVVKEICLSCFKKGIGGTNLENCNLCGTKLSAWNRNRVTINGVTKEICNNCYYMRSTIFDTSEFQSGKSTVVMIAHGDAQLKLAALNAEKYGYELVNTSQSQNNWGLLETKYTLIFKKKG